MHLIALNRSNGGNGSGGTATQYNVTQTAHGLSADNVVRFDGVNYVKALADSALDAEVIGHVSVVIDANTFTLVEQGQTITSGKTPGVVYFLSDVTPGLLTATEPTAIGSVSKPLLIATSATAGVFNNMRGEVLGTGGVNSISNADGTLIITPTTGDPVASLNLNHTNLWNAQQQIPGNPFEYTFNGV